MEDRGQWCLVPRQRWSHRGFEPVEKREVPIAAERVGDITVRGSALLLERLEQARRSIGIGPESTDLRPEAGQHDVEVAGRAEMPTEPSELLSQRGCPVAVDERTRSAEKCPHSTCGDPKLVEVFRIIAPARPRIVGEDAPVFGLEGDAESLARCSTFGAGPNVDGAGQVESAIELGP